MINNIILRNIATYDKNTETIIKPSKVNFIYGNNGTGKTTITRVIENPKNMKIHSYCGMTILNVVD